MSFPDRIERTVELAHPPARVWTALTTAEGLGSWFGTEAEIDLRPGGKGVLVFAEENATAPFEVRIVEPPHRFAYVWGINGLDSEQDPRRTFVEFTLEATGTGTRLTVVETGFAQVPADIYRSAIEGNTDGWRIKLGDLTEYLDGA
jgi:uncharacterized protein YndB with AHSA1/START domain